MSFHSFSKYGIMWVQKFTVNISLEIKWYIEIRKYQFWCSDGTRYWPPPHPMVWVCSGGNPIPGAFQLGFRCNTSSPLGLSWGSDSPSDSLCLVILEWARSFLANLANLCLILLDLPLLGGMLFFVKYILNIFFIYVCAYIYTTFPLMSGSVNNF